MAYNIILGWPDLIYSSKTFEKQKRQHVLVTSFVFN
jgi:hypothetical protein